MPIKLNGATSGSIELDVPATVSGGDVNLTVPGAGTLDRLERAGNILQVKQTHLTTQFSVAYTAGTYIDITGLNVSITPSSTANKILVFARVQFEINNSSSHEVVFGLTRNASFVGNTSTSPGDRRVGMAGIATGYWADDASSTQDSTAFNYLDSPNSTSSLTYEVRFVARDGSTMYVNRSAIDTNSLAREYLTSSITVMEVAA